MAKVTAVRAELLSWEPGKTRQTSQTIASAEEVVSRATELLGMYQGRNGDVPGLTLHPEDKRWGSMEIGVAAFGWALSITSEDYLTQHCTKSGGASGGSSVPVRWDEQTLIPRENFIPQQLALEGVRYWLETGGMAPELRWSDDCA